MTYIRWAPCGGNCCGNPCLVCQDNFTRANTSPGDPLNGCGYSTSGTWQIDSNTLLGAGTVNFQYRTDGFLNGGYVLTFTPVWSDQVTLYIGDTSGSSWYRFVVSIVNRSYSYAGGQNACCDIVAYDSGGNIVSAYTYPIVTGTAINIMVATLDMYVNPQANWSPFNYFLGPASGGTAATTILQSTAVVVCELVGTYTDPATGTPLPPGVLINPTVFGASGGIVFADILGLDQAYGAFKTTSSKRFTNLDLIRMTGVNDIAADIEDPGNPSCGVVEDLCEGSDPSTTYKYIDLRSVRINALVGSPGFGSVGALTGIVPSAANDEFAIEYKVIDFSDQMKIRMNVSNFTPVCNFPDSDLGCSPPALDLSQTNEIQVNLGNGYYVIFNSGVALSGGFGFGANTQTWLPGFIKIGQGLSILAQTNITLGDVGYNLGLNGFNSDPAAFTICYNNGILSATAGSNLASIIAQEFLTYPTIPSDVDNIQLSIATGTTQTFSETLVSIAFNRIATNVLRAPVSGCTMVFATPASMIIGSIALIQTNNTTAVFHPTSCTTCPAEIAQGTGPTSLTWDFLLPNFLTGSNSQCDLPSVVGGAFVLYRISNNNLQWQYTQPFNSPGCGFVINVIFATPGLVATFSPYSAKIIAWVQINTDIGSAVAVYGANPTDNLTGNFASISLVLLYEDDTTLNAAGLFGPFPSSIVIHP